MRFELLMVLGNQFSLKLNDFLCSFIIPHRNWQFLSIPFLCIMSHRYQKNDSIRLKAFKDIIQL